MDKESYILLVDDEESFLSTARFSLKTRGFKNVVTCSNPQEVGGLMEQHEFCLIVLDNLMPGMTGLELLPLIKEKNKLVPVIMLTALNEVDIVVDAMKKGAFDYLVKPVDKERLVSRIENALEHFNVIKENIRLESLVVEKNLELESKNRMLESTLKELKETQQQLVMNQNLTSMGKLVAGLAHELNNPVGAMRSASDVIERSVKKLRESEGKEEKFLSILEANSRVLNQGGERVQNLITNLKHFAHLDEAEWGKVDIIESVEQTINVLCLRECEKISVELLKEGESTIVSCYPVLINVVLLNLLRNAVEAMEESGEIKISVRIQDKKLKLEIRDTGRGIPQEDLEKVFEPGYTSKGTGVGTGLGLSICYQILKKHRGQIYIESSENQGTTVTLEIDADGEIND